MTGRIISLIREAKDRSDLQQNYEHLFSIARRRVSTASDAERLLNVMSQLTWQTDLNIGPSLPPVLLSSSRRESRLVADDNRVSADSEREGHGQDQAGRDCPAARDDCPTMSHSLPTLTGGVLPVNSDVTHDVDQHGRRRHSQPRRKCRRHHHHEQQGQATPVETPAAETCTTVNDDLSTCNVMYPLAATSSIESDIV